MSMQHRRFMPFLALVIALLPAHAALAQPAMGGGRAQLDAARTSLAYAQANVDNLKQRAMKNLARDRQWATAKAALEQAQKERQAARDATAELVSASADYRTLQRQADAATSETQKAELRAKMATMIYDAQLQSYDCQSADARVKEAQAALDARWKEYEATVLASDPTWTSAVSARDAARAQVAAAMQSRSANRATSPGGSSGRSSSGSRGRRSY